MTTCELRKKAAEVIETRGWHRGSYIGQNGAVCMLGALHIAAFGNAVGCDLTNSLEARIAFNEAKESIGLKSIPKWNDRKGRTKNQVIERLLKGCE